jgi:hypothetical protein
LRPLITAEEEKELLNKLIEYYQNIYPGLTFTTHEDKLSKQQIGDVFYTYPGAEAAATFDEKVEAIKEAVEEGYDTPVIILRKPYVKKDILLDGHRRLKVAWEQDLDWNALIMIPSREHDFGIEKMIKGRISEVWG